MIDNEQIKTAIISKLKANTTIVAALPTVNEIRETQWQGTDFQYPNLRVRVIDNTPVGRSGCYQNVSIGIMAFSEQASSKEADQISGIIMRELNDSYFTENGLAFNLRITNITPAARVDARTWRSEAIFKAIVS